MHSKHHRKQADGLDGVDHQNYIVQIIKPPQSLTQMKFYPAHPTQKDKEYAKEAKTPAHAGV